MTPDELVAMTEKIGDYEGIPFKMTRPTILRYEKTKLIPEPKRGGHGRGVGRWTDYPAGTVEQIYAAWCLIHGHYGGPAEFFFSKTQLPEIPPESVRSLRKGYLLGIVDPPQIPPEQENQYGYLIALEWAYTLAYKALIKECQSIMREIERGVKSKFDGCEEERNL